MQNRTAKLDTGSSQDFFLVRADKTTNIGADVPFQILHNVSDKLNNCNHNRVTTT